MFEIKPLTEEGIPGALAMAEHYRLLNEPSGAESIYLDILQVDPENQRALMGLLLAVTDQFDDGPTGAIVTRARDVLPRLRDDYERAYYAGIICERRAKAQLRQGRPGAAGMAYESLREAKSCYQTAEAIRPPGNDEVLLRWNACARLMLRHALREPASEERYEPYQD